MVLELVRCSAVRGPAKLRGAPRAPHLAVAGFQIRDEVYGIHQRGRRQAVPKGAA